MTMRYHATLILAAAQAFILSGCYPSFAPPVRTNHGGAPGKISEGQLDLSNSLTFVDQLPRPTGIKDAPREHLTGYAMRDAFSLEAGISHLPDTAVLGFGGIRYTPLTVHTRTLPVKPTLDVEFGLGAGVGGERCDANTEQCDTIEWHDRPTAGGYTGAGMGLNIAWFDLFVRCRWQLSIAENVPLTHWISTVIGMELTIFERLRFRAAGGTAMYSNPEESLSFPIAEIGMAVFIDTPAAKR